VHYRFEITLIVNSVLDEAAPSIHSCFARDVMRQYLRRYLLNYHREHAQLPTGRHYLGMTRPLNLEVGMIDFDAIRSGIHAQPVQMRGAGTIRETVEGEERPKNEVS
jgi:hypothetical protein